MLIAMALCATAAWSQAAPKLEGDIGRAAYRTPPVARTADRSTVVLPYVYADYGAFYGRVDTFGYKATPLGKGHLELAARVSVEGYRPGDAAFGKRATPVPIGLGTFQETPYGAFFAYGFHDATSGGTLLDLSYAAEFSVGPLHVYPLAGIERRSARYVDHLYGVNAAEALRAGVAAYSPGASTTPSAGIALDYPVAERLKLTAQVRRRWLDRSITASPLVDAKAQTSGLVAIARSFD